MAWYQKLGHDNLFVYLSFIKEDFQTVPHAKVSPPCHLDEGIEILSIEPLLFETEKVF